MEGTEVVGGARSALRLTDVLQSWVVEAERMHGGDARAIVVTPELFADLEAEQGVPPVVAGLTVAAIADSTDGAIAIEEMVEIEGPDRVCIYVGSDPDISQHPLGLDPAMPVMFVPRVLHGVRDPSQLEMYNRLRWYGLSPDEALAGSLT